MNNNFNKKNIGFKLYVLDGCPFCAKALKMLDELNLNYDKIIVDYEHKEKYKIKHKMDTFPQIFFEISPDMYKIGGCDDLEIIIELSKKIAEKTSIKIIAEIVKMLEK